MPANRGWPQRLPQTCRICCLRRWHLLDDGEVLRSWCGLDSGFGFGFAGVQNSCPASAWILEDDEAYPNPAATAGGAVARQFVHSIAFLQGFGREVSREVPILRPVATGFEMTRRSGVWSREDRGKPMLLKRAPRSGCCQCCGRSAASERARDRTSAALSAPRNSFTSSRPPANKRSASPKIKSALGFSRPRKREVKE